MKKESPGASSGFNLVAERRDAIREVDALQAFDPYPYGAVRLGERAMTPEMLRSEIEELLRDAPTLNALRGDPTVTVEWIGRATAALNAWSPGRGSAVTTLVMQTRMHSAAMIGGGYTNLMALLHEARHSLRIASNQPTAVAISAMAPFTYFDELRRMVATANSDVFFVDPYLDADFVGRYLPHVKPTANVRLLTQKGGAALSAAAALFTRQHGTRIDVRSASTKLHDRFVFLDGQAGYQSGASFKDGGDKAPTTLTEMVDVFRPVLDTYEKTWLSAKMEP